MSRLMICLVPLIGLLSGPVQGTPPIMPPLSLQGDWLAQYETVVDWDLPVVGKTQQRVLVEALWSITQTELHFEARESICQVGMTSGSKLVKLALNGPNPPGLSGSTYTGKWVQGRDGWSIKTSPLTRFHGLKKPWPKDLPESIPPEQLDDVDADEKPGLSLFLRGVVISNLQAVQKDVISFEGIPGEEGAFVGTVDWKWERKLLHSSNPHVKEMPRETWDPKLASRPFRLEKRENKECPK